MILVDSSVWIAQLRGQRTPATVKLEEAVTREPILVGDLILFEILQGARDDAHAARIERGLGPKPTIRATGGNGISPVSLAMERYRRRYNGSAICDA